MILRKKLRGHDKPLLAALNWVQVELRIQYKLRILAYRHFEGSLPPYLYERLTTHLPVCCALLQIPFSVPLFHN